jgi:hypothetical protein
MTGQARDLLTPFAGTAAELANGSFRILASPRREILEIAAQPHHPGTQALVGVRGGAASRDHLSNLVGSLEGGPLFQLLDDFAGASLVAAWAWSRWEPDWAARVRDEQNLKRAGKGGAMENICTGFASGSSSLNDDGSPNVIIQRSTAVGPLQHPDDPIGWHPLSDHDGPQHRRARRIDLWREAGVIMVDAGFQDSSTTPDGGRAAVHEYQVYAEIEEPTGKLVSLQVIPHLLPYRECPGAAAKVARLVGQDVRQFRDTVPKLLHSTLGCTHLNDVMRAFADIPRLAERLPPGEGSVQEASQ